MPFCSKTVRPSVSMTFVFHHSSALGISRTVGKPSGPELTDLMSDCEKPTFHRVIVVREPQGVFSVDGEEVVGPVAFGNRGF